MYFESYDGCRNVGRKGRSILVACFTKEAEDPRKKHVKYDRKSLENLLKNPPASFEREDYQRARFGLADIMAHICK